MFAVVEGNQGSTQDCSACHAVGAQAWSASRAAVASNTVLLTEAGAGIHGTTFSFKVIRVIFNCSPANSPARMGHKPDCPGATLAGPG